MSEVVLRAGELSATFWPDASMVGSSLTHRGEELLGQRGGLAAWRERGKSFGIPFLHPWANRLGAWDYRGITLPREGGLVRPEEHGLPLHGLLHGGTAWDVPVADDAHVLARYDFGADERRLALFPYPHLVEVEVTLDEGGLTHATRLRATGDVPVPVAFGWHPYFVLPGVERRDWRIWTTVRERLLTDDRKVPTGEVADEPVEEGPLGDREYDHGYRAADRAAFSLTGGGRRIEVRLLSGYTHAQWFAPLDQVLVSFEPMTAPADALRSGSELRTVPPGRTFAATFRIGVRDA